VCPGCAEELGDDGWCEGHIEEGRAARRWARQLPDRWADAVTLWWIATGELRREPPRLDPKVWSADVRAALGDRSRSSAD
jgi:hypothetical protein